MRIQRYSTAFFIFFLSMLFLLQAGPSYAGDTNTVSRNITESQWNQLTNDPAFGYKDEKEHTEQAQPQKENFLIKTLRSIISFFGTTIGQILIWGLLFIILAYAMYKIIASKKTFLFKRRKKKLPATLTDDPEEENIAETNWEAHLQKAINNGDLRLAVRYSYMWLLRLLQEHNLIAYRDDKTNYEYYNELTDTAYKQPFKQLSRQYEYVWYGNFDLNTVAYNEYMNTFNALKGKLRKS